MTATDHPPTTTSARPGAARVYSVLIGLATLAILLQGLWAGIFLEHDGKRDDASSWIDAHARGADVASVLVLAAGLLAFVKLRARRDLWVGALALLVLLGVESWLGTRIRSDGKDSLTAVHVPLAMALMALAVWLSVVSGSRRD